MGAQYSKESFRVARNMVAEDSCGPVGVDTKANLIEMICMAKACTCGMTAVASLVSGFEMQWRPEALCGGPMAESTKATSPMDESMERVRSSGPMADFTAANGARDSSMVEPLLAIREASSGRAIGRTASSWNGLMAHLRRREL